MNQTEKLAWFLIQKDKHENKNLGRFKTNSEALEHYEKIASNMLLADTDYVKDTGWEGFDLVGFLLENSVPKAEYDSLGMSHLKLLGKYERLKRRKS